MARESSNNNGDLDKDFIGKLPDCVLHSIVSLLPYKEATRTAVLARRWRRLLPPARVVDLDERKVGFLLRSGVRGLMEKYNEPCIDMLSLTLTLILTVSSPEVRDLVSFAAGKRAKVVLLDFSRARVRVRVDDDDDDDDDDEDEDEDDDDDDDDDGHDDYEEAKFDLPANFYANTSLETLKLYWCKFDPLGFANFGSLLHISLGFMELSSASLETMVKNCASLKSLSLEECTETRFFVVKSRSLERLIIENCEIDLDCWIEIHAPNLKFWKYSGDFCNFDVYVTERLDEAVLDLGTETEFDYGRLLVGLFSESLYEVRVLTVCSYILQTIPSGDELERDLDVKHLTLKTSMHENEGFGIGFFLNSCPSLETLVVEIDPDRRILENYECPFEGKWAESLPIYSCVRRTLKVVDVKGYRGSNDEFYLLSYFVVAGLVMQKLNVEFSHDTDMYVQKARMLQLVKKASPNLQISISIGN